MCSGAASAAAIAAAVAGQHQECQTVAFANRTVHICGNLKKQKLFSLCLTTLLYIGYMGVFTFYKIETVKCYNQRAI